MLRVGLWIGKRFWKSLRECVRFGVCQRIEEWEQFVERERIRQREREFFEFAERVRIDLGLREREHSKRIDQWAVWIEKRVAVRQHDQRKRIRSEWQRIGQWVRFGWHNDHRSLLCKRSADDAVLHGYQCGRMLLFGQRADNPDCLGSGFFVVDGDFYAVWLFGIANTRHHFQLRVRHDVSACVWRLRCGFNI